MSKYVHGLVLEAMINICILHITSICSEANMSLVLSYRILQTFLQHWLHFCKSCISGFLSIHLWRKVTLIFFFFFFLSRLMTKSTKWHVRPAKTKISLAICPV